MRKYIILILLCIALLSISCDQRYEVYGVCRHDATYALCVAGKIYPTRMTFGDWGRPAGHNKSQAFVNGEWKWLCVDYPAVYFCPGDDGYIDKVYYTSKSWVVYYAAYLKS